MAMSRRAKIVTTVIVIVLVILIAAVLLSWLTTTVTWDGRVPKGEWSILVQDHQGNALPDACVTVLSKEGQPVSFESQDTAKESRGPFDNYSTPEGVCADRNGVIRLQNTRSLGYGGRYWKLLWVWHIGSNPSESPMSLILRVSAPDYEDTLVSVDDLVSQRIVTVTLERVE
jgi:hypothetical protein